MIRTLHALKSDENRQRFIAEFSHEFTSKNSVVNINSSDIIYVIGNATEAEVISIEGRTLADCITELSSAAIRPVRLLVMIQAADVSELTLKAMSELSDWIETLPDDMDVIWGVGSWYEPDDCFRLTVLLPKY